MPQSSSRVASAPGPLTASEAREVAGLVAALAAADGGDPLAEDARLVLDQGPPAVQHVLAREGDLLVGYAQLRRAPGSPATAELVVHPDHRRRGVGTALADALARTGTTAGGPDGGGDGHAAGDGAGDAAEDGADVIAWAHGGADRAGAEALAAAHGLQRVRELWRMERRLDGPALPPLAPPPGVRLRAFAPGRDEEAWLGVNARAFADHPEQGRWTRADLDRRLAEDWFDPAGLLLAVDDDDRLLASHWTKTSPPPAPGAPPPGEVYVVGVDPSAQGRGLGGLVVLAGLHHLRARGVEVVDLYVEGDNAAAHRTYDRLGFVRVATDTAYGPVR